MCLNAESAYPARSGAWIPDRDGVVDGHVNAILNHLNGKYLVDKNPSHMLVIADPISGPGQKIIEPMLNIWLREKNPENMLIFDRRGDYLVKYYTKAKACGYDVVPINLADNGMGSVGFNPLSVAIKEARKGDITGCCLSVTTITETYFGNTEEDKSSDPIWSNSAKSVFKCVLFAILDYCTEQETILRNQAPNDLQKKLDDLWGSVTLENVCRICTELVSLNEALNYMTSDSETMSALLPSIWGTEARNGLEFISETMAYLPDTGL